VIEFVLDDERYLSMITRVATSMKVQCIYAFPPVHGVDANHWRFAGEFNCSHNGIEPFGIEAAFELPAGLPFLS
jgi:hypothetical protein